MMKRERPPEDFRGLTKDEAAEMIALDLTREQWEMHRLCKAHGDLVCSLIHLRQAEAWFSREHGELASRLGNVAEVLGKLVPDYMTWKAATAKVGSKN